MWRREFSPVARSHRGAAATVNGDGSSTIHVGSDVGSGDLFAAHACVWTPEGVTQFWSGAATSATSGENGITSDGCTAASVGAAAQVSGHPTSVVGATSAEDLAAKLGVDGERAELLQRRLSEHGVTFGAGAKAAPKKAAPKKAAPKKAAKKAAKAEGAGASKKAQKKRGRPKKKTN